MDAIARIPVVLSFCHNHWDRELKAALNRYYGWDSSLGEPPAELVEAVHAALRNCYVNVTLVLFADGSKAFELTP
jgi:hypothetical protein